MEYLSIGMLLGGVGLFLLGMEMMTEGLKLAAGPALGRMLVSSTRTRLRGLISGLLLTALVQSSSAVTVAAIGFVNAGLLSLGQSLWVLFGSNVGSTMTGWLVALVGLKIKIEAAALPLIGIGMALRLSAPAGRRGAYGSVLTGFGALFLGIGLLQQAFAGADQHLDLSSLSGHGAWSILAFAAAGLALTTLMQSSAAAIAILLTLAESGVIPLQEAAGAVIGANIGTTVTALLAVIGATANAKRAAMAHVIFNVLTGLVALLLLPALISGVEGLRSTLHLDAAPAVSLALFHTTFNLLGIVLMWPLTGQLTAFLQRRFRSREEELGQPQFIDRNVASVPALAADALSREMVRLGSMALSVARGACKTILGNPSAANESQVYASLSRQMLDFVTAVSRRPMSDESAQQFARLLRIQRYYDQCGELAGEVTQAAEPLAMLDGQASGVIAGNLVSDASRLLAELDPAHEAFSPTSEASVNAFEEQYQAAKARLLLAAAAGEMDLPRMEAVMRSLSALRRMVEQAAKAARLMREQVPA